MTPKFITDSQRRKLELKTEVFATFQELMKDGSTRTAVFMELSKRFGVGLSTIRNYVTSQEA